jgi:flagellar biosynthesis/type III secretory pathway M-ring protein FliF/YscJ
MAYDEIIPDKPSIDKIENKEQAVAYVLEKGIVWSVVGFIAFLLITNVLVPLITRRWGYNEAKNKYREVVFEQDKE